VLWRPLKEPHVLPEHEEPPADGRSSGRFTRSESVDVDEPV
jgi:hypothetical protein